MRFSCDHCGREGDKPAGHIKRSRARGDNVYCDRVCAGLGRRKHKTKAQKIEEKRLYDMDYRERNLARLTAEKRTYHKRTYDPAKAAIERKAKMPRHVEYCRQPAYRAKKKIYDREHRAKTIYREFWECALLTDDIRNEALTRMTDYEIRLSKGTLGKAQQRKRDLWRAISAKSEIGALVDLKRGQKR